jgi:hypothetical protein
MSFPWTEENVEFLRDLFASSPRPTAPEMAVRLYQKTRIPIEKNAVIGKLARLGLKLMDRSSPGEGPRPRASRAKPGRFTGIVIPTVAFRCKYDNPGLPPEQPESSASICSIMDLDSTRCRWVVGSPQKPLEAIYCGSKVFSGCYCREHWNRSRGLGTPSERRVA